MRDKKTYFVTLRDSIPVVGFLNNQLKGRLVKRDTLIPGEEVQIGELSRLAWMLLLGGERLPVFRCDPAPWRNHAGNGRLLAAADQ